MPLKPKRSQSCLTARAVICALERLSGVFSISTCIQNFWEVNFTAQAVNVALKWLVYMFALPFTHTTHRSSNKVSARAVFATLFYYKVCRLLFLGFNPVQILREQSYQYFLYWRVFIHWFP